MLDIAENVESRVRRFDVCRSIDACIEGEDMHHHRIARAHVSYNIRSYIIGLIDRLRIAVILYI